MYKNHELEDAIKKLRYLEYEDFIVIEKIIDRLIDSKDKLNVKHETKGN